MSLTSPIAAPSGTRVAKRRVRLPGSAYLVTWMTRDRQARFDDLRLARRVVAAMRALDEAGRARSMAWVLMPDHLHWLVQPEGRNTLGAVLAELQAGTGDDALWAEEYAAERLSAQADIREISREIVANPLRWGLVEHLGDYPHWDAIWI